MGKVYAIHAAQQGHDDWTYTLVRLNDGWYDQHENIPGRRLVAEMEKAARFQVEDAVDIGLGRKWLVIARRWSFQEGRVRYTLNTPHRDRQDLELWEEEMEDKNREFEA